MKSKARMAHLDALDKRKVIKFKCRSCKRAWTSRNFRDKFCIFCRSDKINEVK